jgi:putative acetyltransferase
VVWGTLQLPYPSLQLWRKRLEYNDEHFLYVACAGDEVVGNVGLHLNPSRPRRKHVASLGMGVRDDWQGRGVGTALMLAATELADRWLNLMRLELEVFTDNEPAIRLYKKFGFEIEGTLRRHAFRDGEYVDSYFMARLRQG